MALLYLIVRQSSRWPKCGFVNYMERPKLMKTLAKPPNILVYSGKEKSVFEQCRKLLNETLGPDCYTVYNLEAFQHSSTAWIPNTKLLILARALELDFQDSFELYKSSGGTTLVFAGCSTGKPDTDDVICLDNPLEFYELNQSALMDVLRDKLNLRCTGIHRGESGSTRGGGFLICRAGKTPDELRSKLESAAAVPVFTVNNGPEYDFRTDEYFQNLETERLGRTIAYFDVIDSTHAVLEKAGTLTDGFVVIARYQTSGKGRSGNVWLSPKGCAMFSIQLQTTLSSPLGQQLSLLQHLAALAIVRAVKGLANSTSLDLGVKWPNDIYLDKEIKVGGVLTTSSIAGNRILCNIGCGLNLDNDVPTFSINQVLEKNGLAPLSLEKYFAAVFNEMEKLLDLLENEDREEFFRLYYQNWLHSDSEVTVKEEGVSVRCKVRGMDDSGYLQVVRPDGRIVTVHPDGNSFDLLNGLIIPKIAM